MILEIFASRCGSAVSCLVVAAVVVELENLHHAGMQVCSFVLWQRPLLGSGKNAGDGKKTAIAYQDEMIIAHRSRQDSFFGQSLRKSLLVMVGSV